MHYDFETERYVMDLPTHCPKCDSELELDIENAEKVTLLCSNIDCDYELDATEEFEEAAKTDEFDEDEYPDEEE